jgi:hypothetical protein
MVATVIFAVLSKCPHDERCRFYNKYTEWVNQVATFELQESVDIQFVETEVIPLWCRSLGYNYGYIKAKNKVGHDLFVDASSTLVGLLANICKLSSSRLKDCLTNGTSYNSIDIAFEELCIAVEI